MLLPIGLVILTLPQTAFARPSPSRPATKPVSGQTSATSDSDPSISDSELGPGHELGSDHVPDAADRGACDRSVAVVSYQ